MPASAQAQPGGSVTKLTIKSDVLGEDRTILVRTPAGYEANKLRYPVLYMTDGDAHIAHTSSTIEFLARKYGLRMERCINRGEMIYHLPVPIQNVLRKVLGTEPESGRFIKHYTPRIINATLFDGVLAQTLSYGDGIYAFMRKPADN